MATFVGSSPCVVLSSNWRAEFQVGLDLNRDGHGLGIGLFYSQSVRATAFGEAERTFSFLGSTSTMTAYLTAFNPRLPLGGVVQSDASLRF